MSKSVTPILTVRRAAFRRLLALKEDEGAQLSDRALSILAYCCDQPKPQSVQEISTAQQVHQSQVSRATQALAAAGLVERHVTLGDRRATIIKPTPRGRALDTRIQRIVSAVLDATSSAAA